jgi:GntR family transcriptional regulator
MPEARSPVPLYHQVFTILSQRIADGTYPVDARFTTEDQLVAEFGVSRATVRQALDEMEKAGLITRKQGRGTFVASGAPSAGQRFRGSLADLMRETERATVGDVEIERGATIPGRIAELLHLEGGAGTTISRTLLMDGQVFAYTIDYLSEQVGALLALEELRNASLLHQLRVKGMPVERARQTIRAEVADTKVGGHLRINFGAPVLFVERTLFGPGREPVEFVQSWYRGDVYEYAVTLDLREGAPDTINSRLA